MSRKNTKQLVYIYNGVQDSAEVEVDRDGETDTPNQGDVVIRNGKPWKVIQAITRLSSDGSVPVVRVALTDRP